MLALFLFLLRFRLFLSLAIDDAFALFTKPPFLSSPTFLSPVSGSEVVGAAGEGRA